MKTAIYILFDPRQPEVIRYVGKAIKPKERLGTHRGPNRGNHSPVAHWSRKLAKEGISPEMRVIEWTEDWEAAETKWIAHYHSLGAPLLNIEAGGLGSWGKGTKKPPRQSDRTFCDAMMLFGKILTEFQRRGMKADADRLAWSMDEIKKQRDTSGLQGEQALAEFDSRFTKDKLYERPPGYMDRFRAIIAA